MSGYDPTQTFDWNYRHVPPGEAHQAPPLPGKWELGGVLASGPLGVAAGPLLNGDWCRFAAGRGFDYVTYKTVRSGARACYDLPNLVPVKPTGELNEEGRQLCRSDRMQGSWAVSFGMPSRDPEVWAADVRRTRQLMPAGVLLNVSVVGTDQPGWGLEELASDYAGCAQLACEQGADLIEANFSCPNVATRDGQLYQQSSAAGQVAARIRQHIGDTPLLIKIGFLDDPPAIFRLVETLAPVADGLVMTNSVSALVRTEAGELLFEGRPRGICGDMIRDASVAQVRRFDAAVRSIQAPLQLIGVGGISTAAHVRQYLRAGASSVQLATSFMTDPDVGLRIRRELLSSPAGVETIEQSH